MKAIGNQYAQEVAVMASAEYLGGECIALAGAADEATIPAGATMALISAEGGAVYYAVNDVDADGDSPGYVPADNLRFVYSISNLETLHVYGAADVKAHIEYYREG